MNTNKELNYRLYLQREEAFTRTDIATEFSRYDAIKNGNVDEIKERMKTIRQRFYKGKGVLSDNPLRNNIYHFVVSAGVIARICIDSGLPHDEAYTLSDIYIRRADQCTNPDEVIDLLAEMQIDYTTRMKNLKKANTISVHIRRSIDYIYDHLHETLTMEELAGIEGLNPSYFSKLFTKETGTPVKAYILNAKINTAQNMLANSEHSISDIALSLGFSSHSAFSAAFKKITGMTPWKYRNEHNYSQFI